MINTVESGTYIGARGGVRSTFALPKCSSYRKHTITIDGGDAKSLIVVTPTRHELAPSDVLVLAELNQPQPIAWLLERSPDPITDLARRS